MSTKRKATEAATPDAADGRGQTPLIAACTAGDLATVRALLIAADTIDESEDDRSHENEDASGLRRSHLLAAGQDPATGISPLMVAARHGRKEVCAALLDAGAPWNAVDRAGKCAGNCATDHGHWEVVNLLVEAGTKAELILGASIRLAAQTQPEAKTSPPPTAKDEEDNAAAAAIPASHEPSTKPDYLRHKVRYNAANTLLLDDDDDAVMMEWERPLMNAHAEILTRNGTPGQRVLNIGFGLGIVDAALQSHNPSLHVIIEAHPTVHEKMVADGWAGKGNVRICFGRWQDELPKLIAEGMEFDGIFYDTYGEHFTDLEDFHGLMTNVLHKPDGVYSFFNGLAPDNLFFHGVACNCVKIQLAHLGLESEFAQCEIQVKEEEWEGVRRQYWHGRDTYYLPIVTWKKD